MMNTCSVSLYQMLIFLYIYTQYILLMSLKPVSPMVNGHTSHIHIVSKKSHDNIVTKLIKYLKKYRYIIFEYSRCKMHTFGFILICHQKLNNYINIAHCTEKANFHQQNTLQEVNSLIHSKYMYMCLVSIPHSFGVIKYREMIS